MRIAKKNLTWKSSGGFRIDALKKRGILHHWIQKLFIYDFLYMELI